MQKSWAAGDMPTVEVAKSHLKDGQATCPSPNLNSLISCHALHSAICEFSRVNYLSNTYQRMCALEQFTFGQRCKRASVVQLHCKFSVVCLTLLRYNIIFIALKFKVNIWGHQQHSIGWGSKYEHYKIKGTYNTRVLYAQQDCPYNWELSALQISPVATTA